MEAVEVCSFYTRARSMSEYMWPNQSRSAPCTMGSTHHPTSLLVSSLRLFIHSRLKAYPTPRVCL